MSVGVAAPRLSRADTSWLTEWRRTLDWPILVCAIILLACGMMLSLAAGPPAAARTGLADPYHYVYRQTAFAIGACLILLTASLMDRRWARRIGALAFFAALILMGLILLVGYEAKGAQRWLRFAGFSLQPSEIVKPGLVILTAWLLAQRREFPGAPWTGLALVFQAATVGLLLLQPDVGQAVLLSAVLLVTFMVAGMSWRLAGGLAAGGAGLAGLLYATLPHVRYRVGSFLNPAAYDTYQIDRAGEAIARGGLTGAGPGEGTVKAALPDAHTDFIFAVLGEEFGLFAMIAVIGLYAFTSLRGLLLAARLEDPYPRTAASGLFALFALHAAINIGVNVSLLPPKGITLPFLSYGGSSLAGTALTLGLAFALIRRPTRPRRLHG